MDKTKAKMKISVRMLDQAKSAESVLAREEARRLEEALPEDHPLRPAVEQAKAELGGDLSGLPPGHPLLRQMESAKARMETRTALDVNRERLREVKQVKKLDPEKARQDAKRVARKQEEDASEKKKAAAGQVNRSIDALLDGAKELHRVVEENEGALAIDPFSRSKVARLKRLLFATERGVSECRIARI
jgi:hypothetical protein